MRKPKHAANHDCCPLDWKGVSDLTGSYEMDGVISRNTNRDMKAKLSDHLVGNAAYVRRTAYNGTTLD